MSRPLNNTPVETSDSDSDSDVSSLEEDSSATGFHNIMAAANIQSLLTYSDRPFRFMPEVIKMQHPEWITVNIEDFTVVVNNIFTYPKNHSHKRPVFMRLAEKVYDSLNTDYTTIAFPGCDVIKSYVPCTRKFEIITHRDLKWLRLSSRAIVMIYHP